MKEVNETKDRYERTVFHAAVEEKNHVFAKVLLAVGVNPNIKEGCGATPLSIAVINADMIMCKLLLENFAEHSGAMFGSFPSPLEMAVAMKLTDITEIFSSDVKARKYKLLNAMQSYSNSDSDSSDFPMPDPCVLDKTIMDSDDSSQIGTQTDRQDDFAYQRTEFKGFPTALVGDVGTCKVNRSVRNRNSTAYGWSTDIPGDMHAKGHLCEAAFKAHGKGGFHKLVYSNMKRFKLTEEAFKKRKFQEQNLQHIQEAVRDGSSAYGFAAVLEFRDSEEFPSENDLSVALRKDGNHNCILLDQFKKWLKRAGDCDDSHKYNQQLFSLFGPLLELFRTATRVGDGVLRETAWVILLPIFAQLDFRNYWTEAFVHVVNFTSLWPLAFRQMIRKNSSVNMSGKSGHNLDMDEYVEVHVVRPLKTYATGIIYVCMYVYCTNVCMHLYNSHALNHI